MPKHSNRDDTFDRVFRALADGTRRAMVERLTSGPASVSQLAEPFDSALPTVVQHLRVLEEAGIVSSEKVGRVRTYQLAPDSLAAATTWMASQRRPQEMRLDRLGAFLAHPEPPKEISQGELS